MDLTVNTCDLSSTSCDIMPAKDYLDNFFKEFTCPDVPSLDESYPKDELQTTPENTSKADRSQKPFVFYNELSDCIYLTLRFHNRRYYIHIREFKRNILTNEEIPSRNGVIMDINTWYEFQYKIFAFNLKYKSSSFVANNVILVLNNNSIMHIKNLKNHCSIDLNNYQLEKLKELAYHLNEKLIYQMYNEYLPNLIRNKCRIRKVSAEKELMSTLALSLEKNILCILSRIYECHGCVSSEKSQSLHACFMFNNLEKFQQLGDMILMLMDLNFVATMFCNEVDYVSESFLTSINIETIKHVLFKTEIKK